MSSAEGLTQAEYRAIRGVVARRVDMWGEADAYSLASAERLLDAGFIDVGLIMAGWNDD